MSYNEYPNGKKMDNDPIDRSIDPWWFGWHWFGHFYHCWLLIIELGIFFSTCCYYHRHKIYLICCCWFQMNILNTEIKSKIFLIISFRFIHSYIYYLFNQQRKTTTTNHHHHFGIVSGGSMGASISFNSIYLLVM